MSYNFTQKLAALETDNAYEDEFTADLGENEFIAVTSNTIPEGGSQREMTIQIMTLGGGILPAGERSTNSGLFVRQEDETSVKATLLDNNGKEVDSNVADY